MNTFLQSLASPTVLFVILLDASIKGALLLALAGLTCLALRRSSAAVRHMVWCIAVLGVLLLPVLGWLLPSWRLPILPREAPVVRFISQPVAEPAPPSVETTAVIQQTEPLTSAFDVGHVPRRGEIAASPPSKPHWSIWVLSIWAAGTVALLGIQLLGMVGVWRLHRRSRPITDAVWTQLAEDSARELGLKRPVALIENDRAVMPMTWGVFRPVLLLPADRESWSGDQRRIVVLHELAHAKRMDFLTQLLDHIACALYWFNPLVWLAAYRLRVERERACDDCVLRAGAKPSDYASLLLDIASGLRVFRPSSLVAIPIARRFRLESRLMAILEPTRRRGALSKIAVVVLLLTASCILLPLAVIRLSAKPEMTFKAGELAAFKKPGVYEQFKQREHVFIVHLPEGKLVAMSAKCPHLECKLEWLSDQDKFRDPCHNCGFRMSGLNFEGPVGVPLPRYRIARQDNSVLVDKSVKFRWERKEWDMPGSYLLVTSEAATPRTSVGAEVDGGSTTNVQTNEAKQTANPAMSPRERRELNRQLILAARAGRTDEVKVLLQKGADINVRDKDGATPLLNAAGYRHLQATKVLIEAGADVNRSNKEGLTAFLSASLGGEKEMAALLRQAGAHVTDVEELLTASASGDVDSVKSILARGVNVNSEISTNNVTALAMAAVHGHTEVVRVLLKQGATVNAQALTWATFGKKSEILESMLSAGATLKQEEKSKALAAALLASNSTAAKKLLESGGDPNFLDEKLGTTPLLWAIQHDRKEDVRTLIEKGAGKVKLDRIKQYDGKELGVPEDLVVTDGAQALTMAAGKGDLETVKLLLEHGIDANATNAWGSTALPAALYPKDTRTLRLLLDKGANVNVRDAQGWTPLTYALGIMPRLDEAANLLIEKGADVNAQGIDGITPLMCVTDSAEFTKLLLSKGADINGKGANGATALERAAFSGHKENYKLLKESGAASTELDDFILAAAIGDMPIVESMIAKGIDVNAKTASGTTALLAAAGKHQIETVKTLIAKGADVNARADTGDTALWRAAGSRQLDLVKILLDAGAKVNTRTEYGLTPLISPCHHGNTEIVRALLEKGADPNIRANDGRHCLKLAAGGGHTEIVKLLLEKGAELNARDQRAGWTALMIAAQNGHKETVRLLIEKGSDLNVKDKDGRNCLAIARGQRQNEIVQILKDAGAKDEAEEVLEAEGADSGAKPEAVIRAATNGNRGSERKAGAKEDSRSTPQTNTREAATRASEPLLAANQTDASPQTKAQPTAARRGEELNGTVHL